MPTRRLERGSVIVEAAATAPLFILLLLMGIETVRLSYSTLSLQYAANTGIRYASLMTAPTGQTREQAVRATTRAATLIPYQSNDLTLCLASDLLSTGSCSPNNLGNTGDEIAMRIAFPFRFLGGLVTLPITVTAVARNEPFVL